MFFSPEHDVIVYHTEQPLKIAAITEGARRLNGAYIAVPGTLDNLQKLNAEGYPIIAPMEKEHYDWPIHRPWKPLPHQKVTANFLVLHKRAFCLNDMGTMKTLSALWAADYLMEMEKRKGNAFRALIIAPLSILRSVWADAIFQNFINRRRCVVLHGTADKRRKLLDESADFYILNHDGLGVGVAGDRKRTLGGLAAELDARRDIRLAIVDEASVYRDPHTKRHTVARRLIGERDYLWLMTGTPTPNGPLDAYGLAKLVNNAYGESLRTYKERIMLPAGPFKWVPKAGSAAAARKLLTPCVRYAIEDCVELPPCTVQRREAELSGEQRTAYKKLKGEAVLAMKSGKLIQAVNQAALRTKLIQIACGEVYDADHGTHALDCAPRLKALHEAIEECAEKIIVFAPLTNVLNMLYTTLSKSYSCALINGGVPQNDRTDIFRAFQHAEEPRILVADPGTMAHGLTLTAASAIVWYAPTDKTEIYIQANKRIDRPGQTKTTSIIQIGTTPVEWEIYKRLEANQSLQGVILKLAEDRG